MEYILHLGLGYPLHGKACLKLTEKKKEKKSTCENFLPQVHSLKKQVCPRKIEVYTVEDEIVM